jgi:hypothetical protein
VILIQLDGLNHNGAPLRYCTSLPSLFFCATFVLLSFVLKYFDTTQVRWDEASSIPRPERVSPWQIEPAVSPPPVNPLPVPRTKRLRPNIVVSAPDSCAQGKEGLILSSSCNF